MKAITIWQPWASLVAIGAKPYEFRSHARVPASCIGQRIAIHAGMKAIPDDEILMLAIRLRNGDHTTGLVPHLALPFLENVYIFPDRMPRGCVVATAVIGRPVRAYEIPEYAADFVNDSARDEHANWAWPLSEVEPMVPPIEARGAQGWWNWTAP